MTDLINWKRLNRKNVYDSKFLKVYEDTVELPNGVVIDDYTVIQKPSIVMVVATTKQSKVITLQEYKYAAGESLRTLPAGHIKEDEKPEEAARRELMEETGFSGNDFEEIGTLYDYPTKDLHRVYVVRATNVEKTGQERHEATENLSYELTTTEDLKGQIAKGEWKASSAMAALTLSGLLS